MPELDEVYKIFARFGPWGLVLIVAIYVLLKGQIEFRYPRAKNKLKRN